jgi:hypothetical protein
VRTRTTVLQRHTHQWVASFGNPGNGQYREELRRAKAAIQTYIKAHSFPAERTLLRLDGQYGNGAVVSEIADFSSVTRGKDYGMLDRADVQARRAPACRSTPQQRGKRDLPRTFRLSRPAPGARRAARSRHCSHSLSPDKEEKETQGRAHP